MREVVFDPDFISWRDKARPLAQAGTPPEDIAWISAREQSFAFADDEPLPELNELKPIRVPQAFIAKAQLVAAHRDPLRWPLLYRLLWRLNYENPQLLDIAADDDVRRLDVWSKQVSRDIHKMHAFVRFKKVHDDIGERYVAWHRPDHFCVQLGTPFFARRFSTMRWAILTPDESAFWDGKELTFGPGVPKQLSDPGYDDTEDLWRKYYASIFNPARIKVKAMKKEMPVRHWQTLPEAKLIEELLAQAPERVEQMVKMQPPSAAAHLPEIKTMAALAQAAKGCRACDLYRCATQTVFGMGPTDAEIVFVGEQPGDQEDLAGEPFIGPAGQLLSKALAEIGIERDQVYLTNAVKHFRYKQEGKRRIHQKPSSASVAACKPWLVAELDLLRPRVLVCLGVTAAQSVVGRLVRMEEERGKFFASRWAEKTIITTHPSSILRTMDDAERALAYQRFLADLSLICRPIV